MGASLLGLGRTVFCHATPRDGEEVVFGGLDGGVAAVVCGHTHMPFLRLAHPAIDHFLATGALVEPVAP